MEYDSGIDQEQDQEQDQEWTRREYGTEIIMNWVGISWNKMNWNGIE